MKTKTVVERKNGDGLASSLADKVPCLENADLSKNKMFDSSDGRWQYQTERNGSIISTINNKTCIIPASSTHGKPNGSENVGKLASHEKRAASSGDHDQPPTIHREADSCAKMPAADGEKKEETASEISSFVTTSEQDAGTKLDFDLNEGVHGDDVNQSEPVSAAPSVYSPTLRISSFSSLSSSPILNGSPAPITVAAPAKGSFMPLKIC